MKLIRLLALFLTLPLFLGACSKSDDTPEVTVSEEAVELLSHVPSDTPYLVASLEPLPAGVIDTYLERWDPVVQEMQNQLTLARQNLEADGGSQDDPGARLLAAVLNELDGNLSREGLAGLGFDIQSNKVVYGVGAFPVIRIGLSDPAIFRTTIQRVLDNADITAPERELQGKTYWRIAPEDSSYDPMAAYLAILPGHLAISVFPYMAEREFLPAFLGLEMPESSDAQSRLATLNRERGYTPYGSGILDLHRMADQFLQPDTVLARTLAESGEFDASSLDPECATEIHAIIDNMPRMTMGTTELTGSAIAYQYRLENPMTLAQQLQALVSRVPAAGETTERILELAFGMRFGPVRDFLTEKATAITQDPYQCEELAELNERATELLERLNQPMPPFINNFRGLRISLTEIMMDPNEVVPNNARGHLAVHVEQPEMFVGMAQMFLPDLSTLSLTPGAPPVQLPESMMPVPGVVAFAAMTNDAIGLSIGTGEEARLPGFLEQKPGPEGTFLSLNYDVAAYSEYTDRLTSVVQINTGEEEPAVEAIAEAAQQVIRETSDRSYSAFRFTEHGLVVDGRMTFK